MFRGDSVSSRNCTRERARVTRSACAPSISCLTAPRSRANIVFYTDTWDIQGHTAAISYTHPWGPFTFIAKYRWHDQTGAHFYRDIFPREQATNFRGRDKELSPLTSQTLKLQASYQFIDEDRGWGAIKKASVTGSINMLGVEYHDFSDIRFGAPVGQEPLYELEANIVQIFVSFWY